MTLRRTGLLALLATLGVLWWRLRPSPAAPAAPAAPAPPAPAPPEPRAVALLASWVPARPTTPAGRLVVSAWAAPLTGVGLLIGVLSRTAPRIRDGVVVFPDAAGIGGRMLRWRGFAAATLGHVIITAGQPSEHLLRHELVHVRQAERWGPLFVPLYLAGLVRYGYRRNPLERAAYDASPDVTHA